MCVPMARSRTSRARSRSGSLHCESLSSYRSSAVGKCINCHQLRSRCRCVSSRAASLAASSRQSRAQSVCISIDGKASFGVQCDTLKPSQGIQCDVIEDVQCGKCCQPRSSCECNLTRSEGKQRQPKIKQGTAWYATESTITTSPEECSEVEPVCDPDPTDGCDLRNETCQRTRNSQIQSLIDQLAEVKAKNEELTCAVKESAENQCKLRVELNEVNEKSQCVIPKQVMNQPEMLHVPYSPRPPPSMPAYACSNQAAPVAFANYCGGMRHNSNNEFCEGREEDPRRRSSKFWSDKHVEILQKRLEMSMRQNRDLMENLKEMDNRERTDELRVRPCDKVDKARFVCKVIPELNEVSCFEIKSEDEYFQKKPKNNRYFNRKKRMSRLRKRAVSNLQKAKELCLQAVREKECESHC